MTLWTRTGVTQSVVRLLNRTSWKTTPQQPTTLKRTWEKWHINKEPLGRGKNSGKVLHYFMGSNKKTRPICMMQSSFGTRPEHPRDSDVKEYKGFDLPNESRPTKNDRVQAAPGT